MFMSYFGKQIRLHVCLCLTGAELIQKDCKKSNHLPELGIMCSKVSLSVGSSYVPNSLSVGSS